MLNQWFKISETSELAFEDHFEPELCVELPELTAQQRLFGWIRPLKWRAVIIRYQVLAANQ